MCTWNKCHATFYDLCLLFGVSVRIFGMNEICSHLCSCKKLAVIAVTSLLE